MAQWWKDRGRKPSTTREGCRASCVLRKKQGNDSPGTLCLGIDRLPPTEEAQTQPLDHQETPYTIEILMSLSEDAGHSPKTIISSRTWVPARVFPSSPCSKVWPWALSCSQWQERTGQGILPASNPVHHHLLGVPSPPIPLLAGWNEEASRTTFKDTG